ncbi:hypothetical protein AB7W11_19145 [Providencia manganoxydans]|uniref:hypothetical protein n=1 Tax=Providencia manganoxydans TaxID=2923283 RepID=UPI0034E481C9
MKKLNGSELNMFERAKVNLCLADRVQSVFADAALEVELTEDDIKSTLLNYLNASTGKDWHLSSSVALHSDIEVNQQIQIAENSHTCKSYADNGYAGRISTESSGSMTNSMSLITSILFWLDNTLTGNQFKSITLFNDEYTGEINIYKNGSHAANVNIEKKQNKKAAITPEIKDPINELRSMYDPSVPRYEEISYDDADSKEEQKGYYITDAEALNLTCKLLDAFEQFREPNKLYDKSRIVKAFEAALVLLSKPLDKLN